ncbi:septal ring lytic transglycosylase RlpA family protein [Flavobacterium sp.]
MRNKILFLVFSLVIATSISAFTIVNPPQKKKNKGKTTIVTVKKNEKFVKDSKADSIAVSIKAVALPILDSIKKNQEFNKLKVHKKKAHASYYHSKFNGKRTASGEKYDGEKYTAAHKSLPFGTMLKITNEANGKYVIVKVNDRGPFVKARDIDLSRKAFMELVDNKNHGTVEVTIEIIED